VLKARDCVRILDLAQRLGVRRAAAEQGVLEVVQPGEVRPDPRRSRTGQGSSPDFWKTLAEAAGITAASPSTFAGSMT
jgi:hypothetical protein